MLTLSDIAREAISRIHEGWCSAEEGGAYGAVDSEGRQCPVWSPLATRFSLDGAIRRSAVSHLDDKIVLRLYGRIKVLNNGEGPDSLNTSKEDAIAILTAAITDGNHG